MTCAILYPHLGKLMVHGAEVSIKALLNERVQDLINQNPKFDSENESVRLKYQGMG